jgi:hypothetical protein
MGETSSQQWSWVMAIGTIFPLYGFCSLYSWLISFFSNFQLCPRPQTPPMVLTPQPHPSKLNLPAFWVSVPAAWFPFAEAKFRTTNITSQRVMFDLLIATLPKTTLAQVMNIINNIPAFNPFDIFKTRLLEAHMLSDKEKMEALFQLGPLGDRKPSQLFASMLSVCPAGMEIQAVFHYLFLQWLPHTLRNYARLTGLRQHPRPGDVSGQAVGFPQATATRGDGSAGASRRPAGGSSPA